MKTIVVILMMANFAGVAFGRGIIPEWLYYSLMPLMVVLLVAYWFASFWFRKSILKNILEKEPEFEIFAGRVPKDPTQDLQRGRLVVTDGRLVLYQRILKEKTVKEVWSMNISEIKSLGFGMLLPLRRRGVRIFTEDDNVEFTTVKILKRKAEFYKALGWQVPHTSETQTGK